MKNGLPSTLGQMMSRLRHFVILIATLLFFPKFAFASYDDALQFYQSGNYEVARLELIAVLALFNITHPSRREVKHAIISHNVWYKISGRPQGNEINCEFHLIHYLQNHADLRVA